MKPESVTHSLRWAGDWPWYAGLTAAALLALAAWLLYRREVGGMRPLFRFLLPLLRATAVLLIVILLGGPLIHHRAVVGQLARLIILVDGSESMQLADPGMDAARKLRILERLAMLDPGTVNPDHAQAATNLADDPNPAVNNALAKFDALPRWQRVRALLLDGKPGQCLLARLGTQFDVQLATLDNSEVKPVWRSGTGDTPLPDALPKPVGSITDLTSGLAFGVSSQQQAGPGAVLLISDGQHNAGEPPLETAKVLAGKKLPVFTLGTGSEHAPRDLAILRTRVPDSVFHEDMVRGEIVLKEEVAAGLPITLSVKDGDKLVWEQQLVTEASTHRSVPFEFPVKEPAAARLKALPQGAETSAVAIDLQVSVTPLDGERELSNNESRIRFRAVTQKRKILLLDGRPRWETRYLKNLYQRDEKWDVNTVVAGMKTATGFARGSKEGTFPADKATLDSYELVIFGDVPRDLLKPEELRWLADFVGKRGGGLILIDGTRGHLREYADTPLGPLLPVAHAKANPPTGVNAFVLTGRAPELAAFALSEELAANAGVWAKLPPPRSVAGVQPLPGAEVLIEGEAVGGRVPLAVLRPFGAGLVYFHAFDDSWRWRFEVADTYHVRFWNQLAGFVLEEPFAARDKCLSLDAGKLTYEPGEPADIRARLRSGEGKTVTDATVAAVLWRDGKRVATLGLTPDPGGVFRGKTAALEAGNYEVTIETAAIPEGQIKVRAEFKVEARQNAERTLLSVNEDLLRQIALTSGGSYFREEQADQLVKLLEPLAAGSIRESETPLLESRWWFGGIVLLLTLEWLIRKRVGML
ncbi:MAG: hypothetical protein NTW21_30830 [Verrucomicrobia bacterium]|nr:hypothetical protein [Verrucomicrobiota bacterium]